MTEGAPVPLTTAEGLVVPLCSLDALRKLFALSNRSVPIRYTQSSHILKHTLKKLQKYADILEEVLSFCDEGVPKPNLEFCRPHTESELTKSIETSRPIKSDPAPPTAAIEPKSEHDEPDPDFDFSSLNEPYWELLMWLDSDLRTRSMTIFLLLSGRAECFERLYWPPTMHKRPDAQRMRRLAASYLKYLVSSKEGAGDWESIEQQADLIPRFEDLKTKLTIWAQQNTKTILDANFVEASVKLLRSIFPKETNESVRRTDDHAPEEHDDGVPQQYDDTLDTAHDFPVAAVHLADVSEFFPMVARKPAASKPTSS